MEMKDQEISELCQLVAETLKVPREEVNLDSGPSTFSEWDSFNHVHLIVAVEERYEIELDVDEIAAMMSVRDIARVLEEKAAFTK